MNGFDISTISGIYIGGTLASAAYLGSNLIWSAGPPDYSTMPLTIESLEDK